MRVTMNLPLQPGPPDPDLTVGSTVQVRFGTGDDAPTAPGEVVAARVADDGVTLLLTLEVADEAIPPEHRHVLTAGSYL